MKVLLYTIEMVRGVERLMPWRTLVEVAKFSPHTIAICSAQRKDDVREYDGVKIYSINYGTEELRKFVEEGKWDVVYYPVAYRQGLTSMGALAGIKARKIAYIPGGLCPLSGSIRLIRMGEAKRSLPYLLDTLTPHSWVAKKLQKVGFEGIVCQAPLTGSDSEKSGWNKVVTALPGKDATPVMDSGKLKQMGLSGQKFILFSGAPAPTRGAVLAMKAFDSIANGLPDTKMVMLMRRDVSSDFSDFDKAVGEIVHKDRFVINYDRLTREQLFCFFKEAYAVMLPFLIIPSEIPLTFFEVMQLGTPVITFENGGTTDYLRKGLKIAKKRTIGSFGDAIKSICKNTEERNRLAEHAKVIMSNHSTWEETSEKWLSILL